MRSKTPWLAGLTKEQRAVATSDLPLTVVEAGPGTGKTRALVARACHLVAVDGASPQDVLVAVFTRAAARVFRERLRDVFGDVADLFDVTTVHALAYRILRTEDPEKRISVRCQGDSDIFLGMVADEFDLSERQLAKALTISSARGNYQGVLAGSKDRVRIQGALERVYRVDRETGEYFAEELLRAADDAIEAGATVPSYAHVLIDEAQDCTPVELAFLLGLDARSKTIVSDPRQSIFDWRGGYSPATWDLAPTHILRYAFRFAGPILGAANEIQTHTGYAGAKLRSCIPYKGDVEVREKGDPVEIIQKIAAEMIKVDGETPQAFLICRTNREVDFWTRTLGDDAQAVRAERSSPHVAAIVSLLDLMQEPGLWGPLVSLLALSGWDARTIQRLRVRAGVERTPLAEFQRGSYPSAPLVEAFGYISSGNVEDLLYVVEAFFRSREIEPPSVVTALYADLGGVSVVDGREAVREALLDEASDRSALDVVTAKIAVGTPHQFKGSEAGTVIIASSHRWPPVGDKTEKERSEWRALYVAMTRARKRLIVLGRLRLYRQSST